VGGSSNAKGKSKGTGILGRSQEDAKRTLDLFERTMATYGQHLRELMKGSG